MEHAQPEHQVPDKPRSAEEVTCENHEVPLGSEEQPQNTNAKDASGEREQGDQRQLELGDQTLLPAQGRENLECPPPEAQVRPPGSPGGKPREVETIEACCGPQELPQCPRARQPEPDFYCVKWIPWKGARTPIIMQSTNGPCPLLAIMNILFLQWKVRGRSDRHWEDTESSSFQATTLIFPQPCQNFPDCSPSDSFLCCFLASGMPYSISDLSSFP